MTRPRTIAYPHSPVTAWIAGSNPAMTEKGGTVWFTLHASSWNYAEALSGLA
ncbi:MAG: hypothetical protein HWE23_07620 [Rhodobacteraceae bacterium]|nr:hypothetical protein [Paracoccaceae bacterium]